MTVSPRLLDPALAAFLEGDSSQYLGTVGAGCVPGVGRVWGITVDGRAGRIRALVGADRESVANLTNGARVALCVSDVATLQSVQLKGSVVTAEPPGRDDLTVHDSYRIRFTAAVRRVGAVTPMDAVWPAEVVAVTIAVDSVFDQTPGPHAGVQLGSAQP
jgi:pyridoxamine 5'-phosphate oxidase-like protein